MSATPDAGRFSEFAMEMTPDCAQSRNFTNPLIRQTNRSLRTPVFEAWSIGQKHCIWSYSSCVLCCDLLGFCQSVDETNAAMQIDGKPDPPFVDSINAEDALMNARLKNICWGSSST